MYSELIAEQAENQIKEQGRVIERINSMLKLEPIKNLLIAGDRNTFKSILKNTPEICGCALEYEPGYKNHDVFVYRHKDSIHFKKLSPVSSRCMIRRINSWGIYDWIFS